MGMKELTLKDFSQWFNVHHRENGFNCFLARKLPISADGKHFIIPEVKNNKIDDKIAPRNIISQSYTLTYEQVYMCTKNNIYALKVYDSIIATALQQLQTVLKTKDDKFQGTMMFDVLLVKGSGVLHETPSGTYEIRFQSDVTV